jgi:hypothetical protein
MLLASHADPQSSFTSQSEVAPRVRAENTNRESLPIYSDQSGYSASGAAFAGYKWSIPRFRADFLGFTLKSVLV